MKFGLSDIQYEILKRFVIDPLKANKAQVYIFGSRARGQHHPFSDIDLLYVESPNQSIPLSEIAKMTEDVENSNLTIKVGLVNAASLAKSYRESVEQDKILL